MIVALTPLYHIGLIACTTLQPVCTADTAYREVQTGMTASSISQCLKRGYSMLANGELYIGPDDVVGVACRRIE